MLKLPGFSLLSAVWTALGLFAYVRYWLVTTDHSDGMLRELLGWLACYYAWLLLTLPVFYLEAQFPLGTGRRLRNLPVLAIAGLFLAYLAYQINVPLTLGLHVLFVRQQPLQARWPVPLREYVMEFAFYGFTTASACIYRNVFELREKERQLSQLALEKSQLAASLHRLQLETLRLRLNPHFLFNCLQNIAALTQQRPQAAGQMLIKLGALLRSALKQDTDSESTLQEELDLTHAYLDIEKVRFPDRLSIFFDIAPGTESALVPSLLLQPIVENATRHGMKGNCKNLLLWIGSAQSDNTLILTVRDNGSGTGSHSLATIEMGIGLGTTCERLTRIYPGQHSFSIYDLPEGGAEVSMTLPLRFKQSIPEDTKDEYSAPVNRGR